MRDLPRCGFDESQAAVLPLDPLSILLEVARQQRFHLLSQSLVSHSVSRHLLRNWESGKFIFVTQTKSGIDFMAE
jgi:hypothetical protein